jgi:hypothetical protein
VAVLALLLLEPLRLSILDPLLLPRLLLLRWSLLLLREPLRLSILDTLLLPRLLLLRWSLLLLLEPLGLSILDPLLMRLLLLLRWSLLLLLEPLRLSILDPLLMRRLLLLRWSLLLLREPLRLSILDPLLLRWSLLLLREPLRLLILDPLLLPPPLEQPWVNLGGQELPLACLAVGASLVVAAAGGRARAAAGPFACLDADATAVGRLKLSCMFRTAKNCGITWKNMVMLAGISATRQRQPDLLLYWLSKCCALQLGTG